MKRQGVALALACAAVPALAQEAPFQLNLTPEEVIDYYGDPTVGDLAVGERGFVFQSAFCAHDGTLVVPADRELLNGEDLERFRNISVEITRVVGNRVSLVVDFDHWIEDPFDHGKYGLSSILVPSDCDRQLWPFNYLPNLLVVSSVNGYATAREVFDALPPID